MSKLQDSIKIITSEIPKLTGKDVQALFAALKARAIVLTDEKESDYDKEFIKPWTPEYERSDRAVVRWFKANAKTTATFEEIAKGMDDEYEGITADDIRQIVANDQQNAEQAATATKKAKADRRSFIADGNAVSLRVATAKKTTVTLKRK